MPIKIKTLNDIPALAGYMQRVGAKPRSLQTMIIEVFQGNYWEDTHEIKINSKGEIDAPERYKPSEDEAALIKAQAAEVLWPLAKKLPKGYTLPEELKTVDPETIFEFRDTHGALIMLQQRIEVKAKSDKKYVPWTYYDDDMWRTGEPEGYLPVWGMEFIGDNTTIFIHEGAKSARAVHRLINPHTEEEKDALLNHPWGEELCNAAHIGWIGGALNPYRTDWTQLTKMGIKRAYIVGDNDADGKAAIPKISQRLRKMTVFSIEFNENFPGGFDLADDFPKSMFKKVNGIKNYIGPAMRTLMAPATWATDMVEVKEEGSKSKKKTPRLRSNFRDMWVWIEESDLYVCKEMPEILRQEVTFNKLVAPFSDTKNTAPLLSQKYVGRHTKLAYRPDIKGRLINDGTTSAINLHTPTNIKSNKKGDPKPWIDFLEYLFGNETERHQVMRWCATIIARPEIRILYAMLLVSSRQGMGKTTLGEKILAPLVGMQNAGFPGERDIVESQFNQWIANKRLVVIGEIYTGQSWKAYNTLKSYVTDKTIMVNEKFMRPYTIENWAHILACSNSTKALRMEETDRRWFYPTVNEVPWPKEKFDEFHSWINSGGLGIIKAWAEKFNDYVSVGEHSPMTKAKESLIGESLSVPMRLLKDWLEAGKESSDALAVTGRWVRNWLEEKCRVVHESDIDIRNMMMHYGWKLHEERLTIEGLKQYVLLNKAAQAQYNEIDIEDDNGRRIMVRGQLKNLFNEVGMNM